MTRKELWLEVLKKLQANIKKAHFITWFQGTAIISTENGIMQIGVPNSFAKDWILNKYKDLILDAVKDIDSTIVDVDVDVKSSLLDNNEGVDLKNFVDGDTKKTVRKVKNINEVRVSSGKSDVKVLSQMLNSRYRLDNFIVGKDNRLPHAASSAVSTGSLPTKRSGRKSLSPSKLTKRLSETGLP